MTAPALHFQFSLNLVFLQTFCIGERRCCRREARQDKRHAIPSGTQATRHPFREVHSPFRVCIQRHWWPLMVSWEFSMAKNRHCLLHCTGQKPDWVGVLFSQRNGQTLSTYSRWELSPDCCRLWKHGWGRGEYSARKPSFPKVHTRQDVGRVLQNVGDTRCGEDHHRPG